MQQLRRWFQLPSPVDLGWSKHDALGMREFTPYQEGKTWEDWREHCSQRYPVRYFLQETFPLAIRQWVVWPAERAVNAVLDQIVPSRRMHLFDLRGIDPLSPYEHGYLDPSLVFWLVGWGSLMRWHRESSQRKNPRVWMSAEQQAAPEHRAQLESYDELIALVHYWTVTRIERDHRCGELYKALRAIAPTAENRERYETTNREWLDYHQESERLEEEMWLRLAKMREYLWD